MVWWFLPLASLFVGLMAAALIPMLTQLFPTRIRYTGLALSYNLGFMAGGTTPLASAWLNEVTGVAWIPGLLLTFGGLSGLVVMKMVSRGLAGGTKKGR